MSVPLTEPAWKDRPNIRGLSGLEYVYAYKMQCAECVGQSMPKAFFVDPTASLHCQATERRSKDANHGGWGFRGFQLVHLEATAFLLCEAVCHGQSAGCTAPPQR